MSKGVKYPELFAGAAMGVLLGLIIVILLAGRGTFKGAQSQPPGEQWVVTVTSEPQTRSALGQGTTTSEATQRVADTDQTSARLSPTVLPTETPLTPTLSQLTLPAETPPAPGPSPTTSPTETPPLPTPTLEPMVEGAPEGVDLEDAVLLYDSAYVSSFNTNFCKIVEYYGALCRRIALDSTELTEGDLLDANGDPLRLIGISTSTLSNSTLVSEEDLEILYSAVVTTGMNLLVSELRADLDFTPLSYLTDGAFQGVTQPQDSHRDWTVSQAAPEITREFTGQSITAVVTTTQSDFNLILNHEALVTPIVSSTDDAGDIYTVYARAQVGEGTVFLDAGPEAANLDQHQLRDVYYDWEFSSFSSLVPLMFTVRYALGDEAWHNDHNYANLTIDDPALIEPWQKLSYSALLREMQSHDFHTTIAMPPVEWEKSQPAVVSLFREYPDRFSLAQHGNNADGYEFYKYSVSEDDEYGGQKMQARPLADQEADILEGRTRMAQHEAGTGIADDRIMIFPYGISPEQTLRLLKKYNYLATVNAVEVPLDTTRPTAWDYGMYQAVMDYESFPSLRRWCFDRYEDFEKEVQFYLFDLFIDKPALFCTHAYEDSDLGRLGMRAFNPVADQINATKDGVEWQSLGNILRHLYLQKTNDDGSVDVMFYTNHVILDNELGPERTFHARKVETLNLPISRLTVNGHEFPYRVENDQLSLDIVIPAGASAEIRIYYGTE